MKRGNFLKINRASEKFFGAVNDPAQVPTTFEALQKIESLHLSAVKFFLDKNDVVSMALIIPTSRILAEKFLHNEIGERELLEQSTYSEQYQALYFHMAFTLPEYRKRGLTEKMFLEAVAEIPHTIDTIFFAWPFSEGGEKILSRIEEKLGIIIQRKLH